ncbi:UDP-N-acetylglucosamine 2-epimerase (non-hydrolysing) [Pasteurella testudinis DSM 23072]|uniref:UDP-N-acetylglucosamine 2-epimerase (Non-hydrolysing) n=1 Tax=Pasteurella testudinis DSM 23072 TaxID=1122938 RepID=A0A1W1V8S0_9PAST|nr:UDP-N-acetylglucosamine 2-epimerase [Pasteurella testudinis]SMB89867.1 UDP-N-acetylglucosamine 2-epimerase (non-hydrolysing) [Pasteurella testudinis DSM 23072]SUB52106.1 Polysialic acid biosynthesis protein P7 [Pasteurella testudinis]
MKKSIAYITGSRAEYGIVKRLLRSLDNDDSLELQIVVTAMHLDPKYGNTYRQIEKDGFKIHKSIPINMNNSNNAEVTASMADCLQQFGEYFYKEKFDAVIILGDRYEMMSVAIAAAMHNIPIIHLHGGEKTLGNYDEFIRHSITKMSRLHLVATEEYRNRVIQLGEHPNTVFNVGALGAENVTKLQLLSKDELVKNNLIDSSDKPYFVVVFHPETITGKDITEQVKELLSALDHFKQFNFVFIGSNSDTGSDKIYQMITTFTKERNYKFFTSVSTEEYLSLIKNSCGLIGNSSSGLIEAPTLKVGTVNIGERQKGRVRGETVVDVITECHSIIEGINKIISAQFISELPNMKNPYFQSKVSENCHQYIKSFLLSIRELAVKDFFDIK